MGIRSRRRTRTPASDPPSRRRRRLDLHGLAERRDWAALPPDVLWIILSLVPQDDILCTAGLVCTSWRRLALDEPLLWRHIDLPAEEDEDGHPPARWKARACAAVRRSAGRCESYRGRVNRDFLLFLARNAPSLRSLHVTSRFDMPCEKFMRVLAKKLPLLEKLVLSHGLSDDASLVALVDHCPRLRLLDAAGCHTFSSICDTLQARLESKIEDLRLPQVVHSGSDSSGSVSSFGYGDEEISSAISSKLASSDELIKIFGNISVGSSADSNISSDSDSVDAFDFIDRSTSIREVFADLYDGVIDIDDNQASKHHQVYAIGEASRAEPETSEAFDDLENPCVDPADLINPSNEIFSELDEINARGPIFARSFQKTEGESKWGHEVAEAARPGPWPRRPVPGPVPPLDLPFRLQIASVAKPRSESHDTENLPETPPPRPISGDSGDRLRHLRRGDSSPGGLFIAMIASGVMSE
ncbi:hypothetical protein QYE76_027429 [Lolium multiflorum]|uniref:F-box domain-containing protein n=1 Tax=Lolium multiflorum TaxID=4521 RepID=A0AAD8VG13_LOLMU|nr:hypothetical protein QYE76_027429 [Lolium multiflorum]